MARLQLTDVYLDFEVSIATRDNLPSTLLRKMLQRGASIRAIHALQAVTLSITSGERVGLIGHNGAGKSTLLKVMAGIYPPQRGQVTIEGHVCPLFEFAAGFEMEANGWDKIRTRALLLGMSPREIEHKL